MIIHINIDNVQECPFRRSDRTVCLIFNAGVIGKNRVFDSLFNYFRYLKGHPASLRRLPQGDFRRQGRAHDVVSLWVTWDPVEIEELGSDVPMTVGREANMADWHAVIEGVLEEHVAECPHLRDLLAEQGWPG